MSSLIIRPSDGMIGTLTIESSRADFRLTFDRVTLETLPSILEIFNEQYAKYAEVVQTHQDSLPKRTFNRLTEETN